MEELIDFDLWASQFKPPPEKYIAVFDKDNGKVISVGPSHAFENEKYQIEIEKETAIDILEGKISIHNCFVDVNAQTIEISEVKKIYKIDDVIHRIIEKKWTDITKPDIYITINIRESYIKFQLTEEFGGTFIQSEEFQPVRKRKILWDGDTDLNFLFTDYNDPNVLFKMISIKLNDLIGQEKIVTDLNLPNKFSVYTRRVFKNYVVEYE